MTFEAVLHRVGEKPLRGEDAIRGWSVPRPYHDELHFHQWRTGAHGPWYDDAYEKCIGSGQFAYCDHCDIQIFVGTLDGESEPFAYMLQPGKLGGEQRQEIPIDLVTDLGALHRMTL